MTTTQIIILVVIVLAIIASLIWIVKHTSICMGGRILQGCGKVLFPWSKKIKDPYGRGYCCMDCLKRDLDLVTGGMNMPNTIKTLTVKESEINTTISNMKLEGMILTESVLNEETGDARLVFEKPNDDGRTRMNG